MNTIECHNCHILLEIPKDFGRYSCPVCREQINKCYGCDKDKTNCHSCFRNRIVLKAYKGMSNE